MNVRRPYVLFLLCLTFVASFAQAASPDVVISQVYGGGGASSGSPAYTNDYVELFNTTNADVPIGGWSLQYGSSNGLFGSSSGNIFAFPAGTVIPAGSYLLVKTGAPGSLGATFTADFTTTGLSMAAGSGKVALANISSALGCGTTPCVLPDARIVDSVSWGASNNGEGGTTVNNGVGLDSTRGGIRKSNGCQDTDNNNADFTVATVATGLVPRRLSSPTHSCGVSNPPPSIAAPANPIATKLQDAAPFTVSLSGTDDGGIYQWSATPGTGVAAVSVSGAANAANVTYNVTLAAGFSGTATFTASLSDTVNPAVTRAVNIAVTPTTVNHPPTINAFANPVATVGQDAAPFTVSVSGLDDNNTFNWSSSSLTGISSASVSAGQGTASATYTVTLSPGFSGTAGFTVTLTDGASTATHPVTITVTPAPIPPSDHVVISQIYGGGGNASATFRNDYVELYNPTMASVDLTGWSIQYGAATNTTWAAQPLAGPIGPGEYYLISLASGGAVGAVLPTTANVEGGINMSATAGKVALVRDGSPLSGCVISNPLLVDLVGFGTTANCREGAANAPSGSNTLAMFRKNGGQTDTNVNGSDFVTGTPNPRRTAPLLELGPSVSNSDPRPNGTNAPRDASITVTFSEEVNVDANWYTIACVTSGAHNDATVAGGPSAWIITPNVNFVPGEQCTVTILKDGVHDQDLVDDGPNTDTLSSDVTFTFTVATGAAPSYDSDVHLTFGNPTDAEADTLTPNNFLMVKPEFTLSYNRDRGTPNWVSWHLADEWVGTLARVDTFRPDPAVPAEWYRVLHIDYQGSGFDRGHMVPNADRDPETSSPINQATFLMTNMLPQAPDNNQGPWADMENDLRALLPANELYIVAGGSGVGGTGSNGFASTLAGGKVTVPAVTWKVVLVIPKASGDDVSRVTAATRTIAVVMPNTQGIRNDNWQSYLTTVDAVEALTGYDFFENLPNAIENAVEGGVNGVNPPGAEDSSASTPEDTPKAITLQAAGANEGSLTYTIVSGPSYGTLDGSGANRTYTPGPDFHGTDSVTFRVNDGTRQSNPATVTITVSEVNDAPVAGADAQSTDEDAALQFAAADLLGNDVAGPANESAQTLAVSSVGNATGGTVSLASGVVTFTPAANFNGPAGFTYQVCDNGVTGGLTTPQCATGTVSVDVAAVNDAPQAELSAPASGVEGGAVSASVSTSDLDGDAVTVAWTVTKNGAPYASGTGDSISFTPDDNGSYVISAVASDPSNATSNATATTAVSNAAPAVASVAGPTAARPVNTPASVSVTVADAGSADTHTATFTWGDSTTTTVACAAGVCTASHPYTAVGLYTVGIVVTDDDGGVASSSFAPVVITNPTDAGSIAGGGWLTTPSGKANIVVNARYHKNSATPTGVLRYEIGGLTLTATSYDYLVVVGNTAHLQGTATLETSSGVYGFRLTVVDGGNGGNGTDTVSIEVFELSSGTPVYAETAPVGGGNLIVQQR